MLIATLILLLSTGSGANLILDGIDQLKDNLKTELSDNTTRNVTRNIALNTALEVVDKLEDTSKNYAKADSEDEKALIKLIEQYDIQASDLHRQMEASYQKRLEYQKQMIALRAELKGTISRDDWNKAFSAEKTK
jgi:hypothetical protein